MNEKKQYIVQIPGKEHVAYWDEDTYAANQEKLYSDYPNAEVTSMSIADPYGDMQDNDQFAVVIPGKEHVAQWDAKTLAANRDKLLQDFGNAQVYRLNNETLQRDMDFIQRYEDATSHFSVENTRFVHDNAERYQSLMARYTQPQQQEEQPEQKASWNPFRGAREARMRFLGEGLNLFAEGVRALRVARTGDIAADDTLWADAYKEYQRRQEAGEPLFQNNAGPSTADKAAMSWEERRAAKRMKSVDYLINRLQKKAEDAGENPEESVGAALARAAETSDVQILQDAADKIIENNSTPMKGLGKVGAMVPLLESSIATVALAASGNLPAAKAVGEITMAGFTATAAGSAMKQARDAGANSAETGLAGLLTAGIFYGMGKIPLNRAVSNVFSSSAAKAATTQALTTGGQNIEREIEMLVSDAAKSGLFIKGAEKEATKILTKEFLTNWGKQIASHTASFATMSAVQAMIPLIYEDPEKYPALSNVINAAKEGAIDGLILGAFTGGFSSGAELTHRMERWKGRGVANIAEVRFNSENLPEVFEYNPQTGQWDKPSEVRPGANYFADVVEMGPDNAKALINDGGRVKMVSLRKEDVLVFRQINLNKAQEEAKEAYKEQGFEQGQNAQTGEQKEVVNTNQIYITEKAVREAQSGGVTEGTQLDLEKANAAMEGRRQAVRDQIQQRVGQQFWKTENTSVPSEDGQTMELRPTEVVDVVTLSDGRQLFVLGEDEKGLAYVDETGANRLIDKDSQDIVSRQTYPLDEYLQNRVQAEDALAEQERMQAEAEQNIANVQRALAEHGDGARINLGTQEEENWAPIVGMDTNPNGGIVVQVDGVEQPMSWKEVAAKLGVPFEPKTRADLVQERLSMDAKVAKYNEIPQGAELQVPVEGAEPMIYKFRSAELVEGDIIIRAEDPMSGDVVDLTPDIINNLDVLTENPQSVPDGVTYGPVLETQQRKNGTTVEIRAKTETKDGVSTTTAVGMRDGAEVGMPTAFMPMPEGLQIKGDYMSIFEDEEGNPRNDVELLGVHEIREGDNGAGLHTIGATIVVRDESGVTTYDVALERTTPPAEDVSTQIFDDTAANQLGITKDYAFTTKGGQIVVNGRKLWDENPRLWAKWNDANPDRNVTTKDFLESKMQGINAEVSKARTNLEMEAKGNQDPDKLLDLREKLNGKELRRQEVQTLLDEYIAAEKALQEAAEAEARAAKEAEDAAKAAAFQAELEAQRQERERKEAEHQVLMSQDEAFRARTEEYQAAPKYVGRATKVNVGGQEYPAHFVLMDASTPLTSHDPLNNFTPTEGFGVDEQGRNLNTRAYDKEAEEQEGARAIGRHPDYRLIEYMPVVTYEGRAVSGNKRLSGRKLAAADGTDADLIKEYRDAREQFDFTDEQLAQFEHPVVVKQLDEPVPYTAKFFDAFNQSIGTAASTVALAAKVAKMTDEVLINRVANLFVGVDDINKVYQNPDIIKELFNILEAEKISPREDRPRYIDAEGKLTGAGEDFVESLLFGSIFSASDDAVRLAMADKSIRRAVAFAFPTLVRTRNLKGEYSIIKEMTDAVTILAQAKADNQGKPEGAIEYYLLQPDLFTGETPVVAATTQLLARVLNDKRYGSLRKVLDQYIPRAELANEGQLGFNFDGEEGVLETKEDILSDVLKQNNIDIQTYGRTEAATAEPELPANDEVYPPSGEYGGGRAEIERPAAESAGGLQAEGNTAAEVAPASANLPRYNLGQSDISKLWLEHEASKEVDKGKPGRKEIVQAIYDANAELNSFRNENQRLDKIADVVELAMTYPDLAISQEVLKRVDANDTALGSLFSMLGTSREQAPMDRLQDKMTDIDRRVKENPAEKDALMNEKAEAIKEFIETEKTVEGANLHATSVANLAEAMVANGHSQGFADMTVSAVKANMADGIRPRSFATKSGHTYILADNVRDVKDVQTAHIHEEEHVVTLANGDHIKLLGMEGAGRNGFLNAIDGWVGYIPAYHKLPDEGVANEFISHAIERTFGLPEKEAVQILNNAGVDSEEIINLVKNRNNGRADRLRRPLPETGRRGSEVLHRGTKENLGQDGRNPQEGSRRNLDRQGYGSGTPSGRGAEGGEVKRTPRYEPATEQKLRAVDSLGSPKPEVITEIGKETTEGTALFSLDKDDRTLVGIHNINAEKLGKAIRMGGLANPSAAVIDIAKQNHFGYGDISLVMPSSLVDKSSGHNIGTFDRDAWTPTYPRIKYFESKQSRQKLNELIKDLPSELQYTLRYKVENYLNGDVYNSGLEYLFLKEKGMEIGMQRTPRKYPNASEKEFMTDYLKNPNLSWNGSHGSEIMDAYRALTPDERLSANLYMNQHGNADGIELIKQRIEKWPELKERYEKERSYAEVDSFLYGLVVDQRDAGKESTGLTIEKAIEVIKQNGLEEEFGYWQDKVIDSLGFDEKFYDHTTYDGTKKYKAHTLENVSAWMKKQGRNASSDHGLVMTSGTLMAKMAQKFNSLSQIRRAKSRLVPMGEEGKDYNAKIDDVKERIKNLVCSFWSDKLSRQSGLLTGELVALDYVQDFLILGKDLDSVVANYNATEHESLSLTDEEKAAFNALREDIRNLPVHYFETKFERPVYLNEFTAAVVPADTPEDIKQSLRDNQLKLFEYDRESDGDRRRAMLEAAQEDGVMFSFIGEIGAERLDAEQDREYRINGLSLAKTMDNHSADPHAIKVATGWEKGLDGKWRYEKRDFKEYDPDGNIQYKRRHPDLVRYEELLGKSNEYLFFPENHEPLTEAERAEFNELSPIWQRRPGDWTGKGWKHPYHNSSKLPDYIDDEELFQAYPEFRDTEIKFKDLPEDTGGYYNPNKNTIIVNAKDRYIRSRASDILLHEIQHMIQEIEGFSGGTSLEEAEWRAKNERLTSNKLNNNQKEFVRSVGLWQNSPDSWKSNVPLERYIGQVASRIGEEYYKKDLTGKDADGLLREYNRLVAMQNSAERLTTMEIYAYTSGEVEARNVVQRRRIGFQNPRAVLAEETEDIARKDQILNMPTYGLLDVDGLTKSLKIKQSKNNKAVGSKAPTTGELNDVANSMVVYHGSAANFDAFDISHAGEGEGAWAHGFGHYVAFSPDTAAGYAWNNALYDGVKKGVVSDELYRIINNDEFDSYEAMVERYDELLKQRQAAMTEELEAARREDADDKILLKNLENDHKQWMSFQPLNEALKNTRHIYTVSVPKNNGSNYIDEMKTLPKEGRRRIAEIVRELPEDKLDRNLHGFNWLPQGFQTLANIIEREPYAGLEIRERLVDALGNTIQAQKETSEILRKAGFVGMTYDGRRDGPSAVIFSSEDMNIDDQVMFSLSSNKRDMIESWLDKRKDLTKEDKNAVMQYLEGLNDGKTQLAAGRWFAAGTIRLPEDMPKVEQAVSVAGKAKVDPLKYDSPMALLDAHADFKPTEKRIDPNTVNTLHKVKEFNEQGIVIYDVDDSEESRQNMRQIINTHYGKDASPWCLLQGDGEGNLTDDSNYYWGVYNAYPKQVAFKDGKLLAFSANDSEEIVWWDRQDSPHGGIPVDRKIPNDDLGRTATYELDADGLLANPTNIHKGNKQNGEYIEWFSLGDDNISKEESYLDGRKHGKSIAYRKNGLVKAEEYYENGEPVGDQVWYYENGNMQSRGVYDHKGRLLRSESYWTNGQEKLLISYKDGQRHGETKEWYENGNLMVSSYWVNGKREGVYEAYFSNGKLKERSEYKEGHYDGVEEDWNNKGILIARIEYKDGQRHGRTMLYYDGGQPFEEKYYVNGLANGTYRHWDADGTLTNEYNYKDNRPDGLQKRFWWETGMPLEFSNYKDGHENGVTKTWNQKGELVSMILMENGRNVRDLLAEGVTEEDADNLNFSFVTDEQELERLEKEPTITLYRAMALIDGKLYPPMSTKEPNGPGQKGRKLKLRQPSELGRWERSDEAPDKAKQGKDGKWYFDLKKGNGGDVNGVLYNPYFHTSASPLNDQFSGAINYPELVTVAVEVPISEFSSGYRADKANDTVGPKDWHSGTVTGQIGEGRQVVLTRWAKPTRIVPDSEVASIIAPKLIDKKIVVPSNVVTPSLKAELEKRGVVFDGKPGDYEESNSTKADKILFSLINDDKKDIFISNAARAVAGINMPKATPQQWLKMIESAGGLKAGEDKWIGLSDWLKGQDKKTLTKEEVADFIAQNKIQIEETHYEQGTVGVEKALEVYNKEMQSYMQDPDELYDYADKQLEEFYIEMQEKYGENFQYEMTESEQVAEERLLQARDDASNLEPEEEAYQQMVYKYGDDFEQAFELAGDELRPYEGMDGEISPEAIYFLRQAGYDGNPVNSTRLDYTTQGLENNHEIALTVPTIEPWGESDTLHFGDAGEGRAIAWIRFGDAKGYSLGADKEAEIAYYKDKTRVLELESRSKESLSRPIRGRMREEAERRVADSERWLKQLDEKKPELAGNKLNRVLVIDEIQSKRHQEGREKGYRDIEKENAIEKKYEEADLLYHETLRRLAQKYPNFAPVEGGRTHPEVLSEVDRRGLQDVRDARKTALEEYKKYFDTYGYPKSIPGAPFEKNWHELAMKRMLRYAAENGYDAIAWTTGEQQADRYNISKVINGIGVDELASSEPNKKGWREVFLHRDNARNIDLQVDNEGVVRPGSDNFVGEKLSDVVGKDLAVKIMAADISNGMVELDEGDMKVGGAGMKGFYDDMLPRFVNKYSKKWGVSVKDMFLPNIGDTGGGITMHSIEVTPEMKESVMEGQPMFSMVQDNKLPLQGELFAEDNKPVRYESLGGLPKSEEKQTLVERTFRKSGAFSFTGKEKIESAGDVAYIFKELENYAVENAFLVFVKKGKPTIVHAGIGDIKSVNIDTAPLIVGIKDFAPDKIYMVHNHPSGRVEASAADITELHKIAEAAEGVPVEGVVIDTVSGEYGLFDDAVMGATLIDNRPGVQEEAVPLDVLTFDKMVFSPDYQREIGRRGTITNAEKIAEYLSAHRLGEGSKINALLLDRQNRIVGNLVLNTNTLSKTNAREQAKHIVEIADRSAASSVILNGDFQFDKGTIYSLKNGINTYSTGRVSLLDMVKVDGKHTQSLAEGTLRDTSDIGPTIQGLKKAEKAIGDWLSNNTRNRSITIALPDIIKRRIDRVFGRQIGDNVITANNVIHAKNNHGINGSKITENSIPLRDSDFELMPDIMVAPDRIEKGSLDASGRESIRFVKNLSNGYVIVVEKEQNNSPDDLETITMWAEKSARVADARSRKRPLQSTSEPTSVSDGTDVVTVISDSDIAKIRKDAEKAIENANNNTLQDSFDRQEAIEVVTSAGKSGFAEVVGGQKNLDELYNKAYRVIPRDILAPVVERAMNDNFNVREHVDAYLHELAKSGTENDETGLLRAVYDQVRAYSGNPGLSDNDIRYMIWKATSDAKDGDLLSLAEDLATRRRWGVGEDEPSFSMTKDFADVTDEAREKYEAKVAEAEKLRKEEKANIRKSFTEGLKPITKAMAAQKTYDKVTVDGIAKFAKQVLKDGQVDALTFRETNRLLTLVAGANGKSPSFATRYSDQLLDLLLDHIVKKERTDFNNLVNVKDTAINQSGVETLGKIDLRGQITMKSFRDSRELSDKEIEDKLLEVSDRLSDPSDAVRSRAQAEYEGLMLAQEYKTGLAENIKEANDLEDELDYAKEAKKTGNIDKKSYDEYVRSTQEAIRENKMERVDLYRDFRKRLGDVVSEGVSRAKAFREANQLRIEAIHHDANRDMQGVPTNEHRAETRKERLINSDAARFFFKPLATFDQMLRVLGRKNMSGEGYLWNRYMRGWVDAAEKSYTGLFEATEELDKKASEVFGKNMIWSDLYGMERKMPGATVRFMDGGEMVEHELTPGNLLYIYMVDKMVDGRMKLRKMGISEDDVKAIKKNLDPRFIELADWLQEDFLVRKRNKYNAVHERMFGAPMADIQEYFPLKILANARIEEVDLGSKPDGSSLSSTTTGSIIKRRKNALALDLLHTDAFSLVIEHLQQMEDWAAFAEYRRDLNTLLSYKHFRNQVQNLNTIYGTGKALWGNFKDAASIASGSYRPKVGKGDVDTVVLNIAKGVTAAKIAFRVNTALKQVLSAPAYLPEVNILELGKALAKPGEAWNWCMENLPVFKKRWKSRLAGDTRLMDTESDWKIWRTNVVHTAGRMGMAPNAFVDAVTIAVGAKSIYETKYKRYIEDGYSETAADRRAKQDATIMYNQTQQSEEGPFVSPMQLDRTFLSVMLTTFRNSSMGYQRQLHDALRGLGREFDSTSKEARIDFMAKQRENEGADEESARRGAKRDYGRQKWRNLARVAIFGFGLQLLWNIGNDVWYLLFGKNDKKKKKILKDASMKGLAGPIEGMAGGNIVSDAWGSISSGEGTQYIGMGELPIVSDIKQILQEMEYDEPAAINDIASLIIQAGVGVNPDTLTDTVVAVIDACNGDLGVAKEAALLLMRIAQIPQSTIDEFYIDELETSAAKAKRMTPSQLAKRYAEYRLKKETPLTNGLYDEKTEERRRKSYENRIKKKIKERKQ